MTIDETSLYEQLSPEEAEAALANLKRYFEIALEIVQEAGIATASEVDSSPMAPTMRERSQQTLTI